MKRLLFVLSGLLLASVSLCQENPLWLRYTAISPDGQTILFTFKGDIYSVPAKGGLAVPLTISDSYESSPVWSHDGKYIAFSSGRYGNFDVYIMPSKGGEAKRLTYHSNREVPSGFTNNDKAVLFSALRQDLVTNVQFTTSGMSELYSVPVSGGRISLVLPVPALDANMNAKGDKIIYHDYKGYEDNWRKHHTSSVTRDIWTFDLITLKYSQPTQFRGEDRNPVLDTNGNDYYFLSEQNGSFNVFKSSLADPEKSTALTSFSKNPVRFLSRSDRNTLCFSYDEEVYTLEQGNEPVKVNITINNDGRSTLDKIVTVNEGFTEARLSPKGKEFVYIFRGEIFVF